MKKRLALLLTAILCVSMFAGCAKSAEPAAPSVADVAPVEQEDVAPAPADEEEPSGVVWDPTAPLIVGLDDTFAPMGYRDEAGTLVGFDIDLGNAVGEQMGVEIKFQPIDWDSKEMELASGSIDCIWNGMSRTPEREASMTLSQNYLNNRIIIMTAPDVEITSKEQLAEYQIGTQAKSAALETMKSDAIYADIASNVNEYPTYDEVILDMQAGRVQVMVVDEVLGQYKNNNLDVKFNVAAVDFGEDFYTIGFRKTDTELCGKVEQAIKALSESGKGEEISQKWFGANLLLEMK